MLSNLIIKKFYDVSADTVAEVSAGSGLIGGIWDAITASKRQHDANTFALGMYDRQRADALADWNRQNAYNSPAAVMSRYKAAGLNPNLIYGSQGLVSPAIRSSSPVSPPPTVPATMGKTVGDTISGYLDTKMKQAQIDNTKQMLQNMVQDNIEKQADIVRKKMENVILSYNPLTQNESSDEWKKFYQESENKRYQANIDTTAAEAMLRERQAEGAYQSNVSARIDNAIKSATAENNITIATQKALQSLIETSKSSIEKRNLEILQSKMLNDVELQKLEIDMQNGGLNAKSPFWQKILSGLIDGALLSLPGRVGGAIQEAQGGGRLLQTKTYQVTDFPPSKIGYPRK